MQYEYLKQGEFSLDCTITSQYGSELVKTGFVLGL